MPGQLPSSAPPVCKGNPVKAMTWRVKATMVENRFENMSSGDPQLVADISRRELLKRGGKGCRSCSGIISVLTVCFYWKSSRDKNTLILAVLCSRQTDGYFKQMVRRLCQGLECDPRCQGRA